MATILCIEDEDIIRDDISELIEMSGHTVLQACDGQEGLEMILQHQPDLVVSDITMPRKNGHELLQELRKNHSDFDHMPFIFLSALSDREDVLEGLEYGADDYLTKPIDFDMLERKIEASLRQVERLRQRGDEQLVRLYKAMQTDLADGQAAAEANPAGPPAKAKAADPEATAAVSPDVAAKTMTSPRADGASRSGDGRAVEQAAAPAARVERPHRAPEPASAEVYGDLKIESAPAQTAPVEPQPVAPPPRKLPEIQADWKSADVQPDWKLADTLSAEPEVTEEGRKPVYGATLRFEGAEAADDQLGEHSKSFLDWLEETACEFIKWLFPGKAAVSRGPSGGVVVCYKDGDKASAARQTKHLVEKVEDHLRGEKLKHFAQQAKISRDLLADLAVVTEALYETEIWAGDADDPAQFAAAIQEQIEMINSDRRAPARLVKAISEGGSGLVPLKLLDHNGLVLPIRFFNFDAAARERIKASFALFNRENLVKAGYELDMLYLKLLEEQLGSFEMGHTIVVDVHFQTLMADHLVNKYLPQLIKFSLHVGNRIILNIRALPPNATGESIKRALKPLGKHASRRTVQLPPQAIRSFVESPWPVSGVVCSYFEAGFNELDHGLVRKAKQVLSDSRTLMIARGLPSRDAILQIRKLGFDGYAVSEG